MPFLAADKLQAGDVITQVPMSWYGWSRILPGYPAIDEHGSVTLKMENHLVVNPPAIIYTDTRQRFWRDNRRSPSGP